ANPSTTPAASRGVTLASSTAAPLAAISPGTRRASAEERAWSSSFVELLERFSRPASLLVAVSLLGGILLLIWFVVQQTRRNLASVYHSATPLAESPLVGEERARCGVMNSGHSFVSTGPPKLSLNLEATEPAVRGAALSGGAGAALGRTEAVVEPT